METACKKAGVTNPDEARLAFEECREATRLLKAKEQIENDNLRDLTYEELDRRLIGLQQSVPDYLANRMGEPAIAPDLDSAKKERANAEGLQKEALTVWETARESLDAARSVRDAVNERHQEARVQFDLLSNDLNKHARTLTGQRRKSPMMPWRRHLGKPLMRWHPKM